MQSETMRHNKLTFFLTFQCESAWMDKSTTHKFISGLEISRWLPILTVLSVDNDDGDGSLKVRYTFVIPLLVWVYYLITTKC